MTSKEYIKSYCVAVTGSIASGKTTALQILQKSAKKQYSVFYSDRYAKKLCDFNEPAYAQISKHPELKKYICQSSKKLKRSVLRTAIFSDTKLKTQLENIIHPLIKKSFYDDVKKLIDRNADDSMYLKSNKTSKIFFYEIPLLFEKNMQNDFFYTIFIENLSDKKADWLSKRDKLDKQISNFQIKHQHQSVFYDKKPKLNRDNFYIKLNDNIFLQDNIYYLANNQSLNILKNNINLIAKHLESRVG